jgi:hypothetical protein
MSTIKSALKNVSPDPHCIVHCPVTAGGKRIKMRLLSTANTVDTTPSARQQELYLYSMCQPASSQPTHPVSAEPTRALPTGKDFQSASFTSAPARRQPSAEKLGRLPTCPFQGPKFLIGHEHSPSTSYRSTCISNEQGQLCSVIQSFSDIPLVLRDCTSTPHWCYVVVSQCVYTPTSWYKRTA